MPRGRCYPGWEEKEANWNQPRNGTDDRISIQGHYKVIITVFHMFKKPEKRSNILSRDIQDKYKVQIKFLEMKAIPDG